VKMPRKTRQVSMT